MRKFIVIQMQINSEDMEGDIAKVAISNTVRQIKASNEEEAIGKFVIATRNIKAQKKLNIECYELCRLISVD